MKGSSGAGRPAQVRDAQMSHRHNNMVTEEAIARFPLGTQRCCDVESTSLTLIQRRNNAVCPVVNRSAVRSQKANNCFIALPGRRAFTCDATFFMIGPLGGGGTNGTVPRTATMTFVCAAIHSESLVIEVCFNPIIFIVDDLRFAARWV